MPFTPVPNVIQVEIRGLKALQHVENRLMVDVFHEPTSADTLAIATALSPVLVASWLPQLPTSYSLVELHQRSLHAENAIERSDAFGVGDVGTQGGTPAPNNVTICASLRTLFTGRSARGRLYWQGLSEAQYDENIVSSATLTAIQSAIRDVRDSISSLGYKWIIVSFFSNGAPRVGGPVKFVIQDAIFTDNVIDSQRRRLPGRGQ